MSIQILITLAKDKTVSKAREYDRGKQLFSQNGCKSRNLVLKRSRNEISKDRTILLMKLKIIRHIYYMYLDIYMYLDRKNFNPALLIKNTYFYPNPMLAQICREKRPYGPRSY